MTSDNIQIFYVRRTHVVDGKIETIKGVPPIGCVALHRDEAGNVARGISICSPTDNWNYRKGANKAIAACRCAMGCRCTERPIGHPVVTSDGEITREAGIWFLDAWRDRFPGEPMPRNKVSWNPPLTQHELQVLDYARDQQGRAHPGAAKATAACGEA